MALFILFAFIGIPLLEIAVFIKVGGETGLGATIIATVLTAIAGTALMRAQGLSTLVKVRDSLDRGEMPLHAAFDGACQLAAGILLLTPGFLTDLVGFLLFLPPVRSILLRWIVSRSNVAMVMPGQRPNGTAARQTYDVDGDYKNVTPAKGPRLGGTKTPDQDPGQE